MKCPVISDLAVHEPLAFCTTYFCEAAFSKLIIVTSRGVVWWEVVGTAFSHFFAL